MEHYDSSFFCDKGKGPKVAIEKFTPHEDGLGWPITIKLNTTGTRLGSPSITIYIKDDEDLLAFRDSVTRAFQKLTEEEKHVLS